jgi:predicted NACHT family NTPase
MELDPYEAQLAAIEAEKAAFAEKYKTVEKVYEQPTDTFSLADLQKSCPEGVNPASK